ncbi:MFS transporter [Halorarum salinum]|uniref:MFS transporter n=1 Tax=Halorarum salinum TaxID=2743089 RepID=UPI001C531E60|nr:MFS transporter [Halobaculum salinum]
MFRGDELRALVRDLTADGRGWVLVAVAGGWFLSLGVRLVFPALLPYLREEFSLSLTVAGLLVTSLWVAYAVGQFPGGILGDRLGEGNALVASTVVSGTTVALVAAATSAPMLFAATMTFGFSTALFGPARFTILSAIYDDREGVAVGLTLSAGELGNAALPVAAGLLAAAASWRLGFGVTVPLFFLMAVVLFRAVPGRLTEGSAVDSLSVSTLRYVARGIAKRRILLVTGVHLFLFFVYQGFTGFYPTYLVEAKGFSPSLAATFFGLFFAAGVVVQPLAGFGRDTLGSRRTLAVVIGVSTLSLAALPFVDGLVGVAVVTAVSSALLGVTPLTQTYLVNAVPSDMRGSGLGLLRTGQIALGATGPVFVGAAAERGHFDAAYLGLAGVAALGIVLLPFVTEA